MISKAKSRPCICHAFLQACLEHDLATALVAQDGIWQVGGDKLDRLRALDSDTIRHEVCIEDPNGIGALGGTRIPDGIGELIVRPVHIGIYTCEGSMRGVICQRQLDMAVDFIRMSPGKSHFC